MLAKDAAMKTQIKDQLRLMSRISLKDVCLKMMRTRINFSSLYYNSSNLMHGLSKLKHVNHLIVHVKLCH